VVMLLGLYGVRRYNIIVLFREWLDHWLVIGELGKS